ncbi:hypothetical protein [Acetobacter syzygii]|uniref:hypothetical protein n=1 Tax=Acetobacter syzygii TaxID=146476 RepID=UPI0039EC6CEE
MTGRNGANFSPKIRSTLAERVGYLCSNPHCRIPTIGPSDHTSETAKRIGRAAHIHAAAKGGPRYSPQQTPEERRSAANGIFLCGNCAGMIDQNNGMEYPAEMLLDWKKIAEEEQKEAFISGNPIFSSIWRQKIHYLNYINIPRLELECLRNGYKIKNIPKITGWLYHMGQQTGIITASFQGILTRIDIASIDIEKIRYPDDNKYKDNLIGAIISFNENFRTKNGVHPPVLRGAPPTLTGDIEKDPHIYYENSFLKLIMPYDPRWITTSTAFGDFRPSSGQQKMTGLAVIKNVAGSNIIASPIVLGFPSNPLMEAFYGRTNNVRTISISEDDI